MTQKSDDSSRARESEDVASRRNFLSKTTSIMVGMMSLTILPSAMGGADEEAADSPSGTDPDSPGSTDGAPTFGFLIDTERCIGAGKCLTACRVENNVPEGNARTWVERYVHYKDGTVQVDTVPETGYSESSLPILDPAEVDKAYFVPKLCNQCEDAPCNQVCPTHASITSPEGIELIDPELCIGCAYCVQACPYGIRFMNPDTGNADKCDWCYHRIMRDEEPACVEACPTGARVFGRLDDPNSELRKRLATVPTSVLKEHLGTHPKLHYIALSGEVI